MFRRVAPNDLFRLAKFAVAGALNTGVGLAVIFVAMWSGAFGPLAANAIGYGVGLCVSFAVNRGWTFGDRQAGYPVGRFLIAFAIAYGLNLGVLALSLRFWPDLPALGQLLGVGVYAVVFYILSNRFVFVGRRA